MEVKTKTENKAVDTNKWMNPYTQLYCTYSRNMVMTAVKCCTFLNSSNYNASVLYTARKAYVR